MPSGGKREGAGRKSGPNGPKKMVSLRLAEDVRNFLATTASQADTIETTIRKSAAFKRWRETQAEKGKLINIL
jgi:hypothetical protein